MGFQHLSSEQRKLIASKGGRKGKGFKLSHLPPDKRKEIAIKGNRASSSLGKPFREGCSRTVEAGRRGGLAGRKPRSDLAAEAMQEAAQ